MFVYHYALTVLKADVNNILTDAKSSDVDIAALYL